MGPFAATVTAYLNALNFDGEDTREHFWGLAFGLMLILGTLAIAGAARPDWAAPHLAFWAELSEAFHARALPAALTASVTPGVIGMLVFLTITTLTLVAATVRRLRDAGKPRRLWLLWFLPGPGTLALAWCLARPTLDALPKADNADGYRAPGRGLFGGWFGRRRAKTPRGVFRNRMAFRRDRAARERAVAAKINPFSV